MSEHHDDRRMRRPSSDLKSPSSPNDPTRHSSNLECTLVHPNSSNSRSIPSSKEGDNRVDRKHLAPCRNQNVVSKQMGYHWKKVRRCTIDGGLAFANRNRRAARMGVVAITTRPVTLDLTKMTIKIDVAVQTDLYKKRGSLIGKDNDIFAKVIRRLPEWYWTGHRMVPSRIHVPAPKKGLAGLVKTSSSFAGEVCESVANNTAIKTVSSSLNDINMTKLKDEFMNMGQRRRRSDQRPSEQTVRPSGSIFSLKQKQDVAPLHKKIRQQSILAQADAKRAPYTSRNAIKKQVVQQFHQSISKFSIDDIVPMASPTQTVTTTIDTEVEAGARGGRRLRLQRSFTMDSFTLAGSKDDRKQAKSRRISMRFPEKVVGLGILPGVESERERKARRLRKMWDETYVGMCNRAAVLNHVIEKADQEEVTVKPINSLKKDSSAEESPPSKKRTEKEKRMFLGLEEQFYHIDQDDCASSSESDEEHDEECPNIAVSALPFTMQASAEEIPATEEVFLRHDRPTASLRLNLRTRSIDCLAIETLCTPSKHLKSVVTHHGRRSIVAKSSPSHIPRLSKKPSFESDLVVEVLNLEQPSKRNSINAKGSSAQPSPAASAIVDSVVKKFKSHLSRRSTYVNAGTQVSLPPLFPYSPRSESPDARPVERQVEARSVSEDGLGSMVRCLHFAQTYIANRKCLHLYCVGLFNFIDDGFSVAAQTLSNTLWAGTNSGQILVFLITVPAAEKRESGEKASAILGKEIQLKHRAPVIDIRVIDAGGVPVNEAEEEDGEPPGPHKVR